MKKLRFVCAALLGLTGFAAPRGEAQICLDLVGFVDGLELYISGDVITGFWRNWDGQGSDVPVQGLIKDVPAFPCHQGPSFQLPDPQYPPKAFVACLPELGCAPGDPNDEWYFLLDGVGDSYDLGWSVNGGLDPPGACALDDVEYDILPGPCPFEPRSGPTSTARLDTSAKTN